MSANICILDHDQPTPTSLLQRGLTFIPRSLGEEMLRRMVAEPVSNKIIRLFGPDSPFPQLKPFRVPETVTQYHVTLGGELPGIKFKEPVSAMWRRDSTSQSVCLRFIRNSRVSGDSGVPERECSFGEVGTL